MDFIYDLDTLYVLAFLAFVLFAIHEIKTCAGPVLAFGAILSHYKIFFLFVRVRDVFVDVFDLVVVYAF